MEFPSLPEGQVPDQVPPVLTHDTSRLRPTYKREYGESFYLACGALGKPDPVVTWYKNNVEISSSSTFAAPASNAGGGGVHRGNRASLSIRNLQHVNSGTYTCKASNGVGEVSRSFVLEVGHPPGGGGGGSDASLRNDLRRDDGWGGGGSSNDPGAGDQAGSDSSNHQQLAIINGPENSTVLAGERAVLECRVRSPTYTSIKWLKKLDPASTVGASNPSGSDIIEVGEDKFRMIQQKDSFLDGGLDDGEDLTAGSETAAASAAAPLYSGSGPGGGLEYLSKMVITESSPEDTGMYICFARNPAAYKYKNFYLTVVTPSKRRCPWPDQPWKLPGKL